MNKRSMPLLIFLSILLAFTGCDSDPHADAREKYLACWNAYVYHYKAHRIFWNRFITSKNEADKREDLRRSRDAVDRIDPYSTIGVDPRLADAIAAAQRAIKNEIDFELDRVDHKVDGARHAEMINAREAALAKLDEARNRVAADLGRIEMDPGK